MKTRIDPTTITRTQVVQHVLHKNLDQKLTLALAFGLAREIEDLLVQLDQAKQAKEAVAAPEAALEGVE